MFVESSLLFFAFELVLLLNEYIENWKKDGYDVLYTAVRLIVCPDSGTKLRKRLLFPSDQWSK